VPGVGKRETLTLGQNADFHSVFTPLLERPVSRMTCYMLSGTLTPLIQSLCRLVKIQLSWTVNCCVSYFYRPPCSLVVIVVSGSQLLFCGDVFSIG